MKEEHKKIGLAVGRAFVISYFSMYFFIVSDTFSSAIDAVIITSSSSRPATSVAHSSRKVSKPATPLKSYLDQTSFKLFLVDVGLLGALSELDARSILHGNQAFTEFKGALTEQYIQQQLIAETSYPVYYYASEKSTYEVDFLLQIDGQVAPLEVKAEENLKSHSLKAFHEKYMPPRSYRISMSGYREQDWMTNIPLWAVEMI